MATAIARHARRPAHRRHRRQPLSPRTGQADGRHAARSTRGPRRIADAQKQLGMKEGFDVGLEMSGNPDAFREMLANMCHGGKIAMLGILPKSEIDWDTVVFNGLTIKGIYGREMYETWYKMTMMIQSGLDITPVITHRFHYTEFEKAFEVMRSGNSGKVVLTGRRIEPARPEEPCRAMPPHMQCGGVANDRPRYLNPQPSTSTDVRFTQETPDRTARRDPPGRALQGRTHHRHAPGRSHRRGRRTRGAQLLRQQLPRPGQRSATSGRRQGELRPLGLRPVAASASSAAPRSCTSNSKPRSPSSWAPRTRSSTARASTPTAGCSRRFSGPRTRSSATSSTTPASSTASGSARRGGCATRTATWPTSKHSFKQAADARLRLDRHRRRLLDGRHHRQSGRHLRSGRALRRRRDGRRLARHRLHRPHRPRHARVPRRHGPRRHRHRARWARRSAARPAASPPGGGRSSNCCASGAGRTCSRTRSRRPSPPRRSRCWTLLDESTALRDKLEENTRYFRAGMRERGFDIPEATIPSARSCSATPRWPRGWPR